jgi:tyrosinase
MAKNTITRQPKNTITSAAARSSGVASAARRRNMAGIRRNILTAAGARQQYIEGVRRLKREFLGPTSTQLGIAGPSRPISTYDLFVVWHHIAMNRFTPPNQMDRNAAHRGPVFLPWHRFMLVLLELQLQRVLGDPDFGLPYWDWAADGEASPGQQAASQVWSDDCMGGQGDPVSSGPFAFNAADNTSWRVLVDVDFNGQLRTTNRGLRRAFAQSTPSLPRRSQVASAVGLATYDASPWSVLSSGFRNRLEGWRPSANGPGLHNRVHVWVGGDMLPSSSPNDPVFYLNHCNVDRIWAAWIAQRGATYLPGQSASNALLGHRIDDQMFALLSAPATPRQMLDVSEFYSYDTLVVA